MSVNTLGIEQIYETLNDIHQQATGQASVAPVDLASFVSMAQSTLRVGYEPIMNAISIVLGDTIVSARSYGNGKLAGLEMDAMRWGGIRRKINFIEGQAEPSARWTAVDGQSVDQYEIKKPKVLETHYYGFDTYADWRSVYEEQLDIAFRSPEEFGAFMTGLATHFNNQYIQWKENLRRALVCNLAGACNAIGGDKVVHLLTEYNTETGLSLTATTVNQPENFAPFIRWLAARLNTLAQMMSERSEKFQLRVTNKPIIRHTPAADLRAFILSNFKNKIDAVVRSDTFDNSYLRMVEGEGVSYWQAIENPDEVQITPAFVDANVEIDEAEAQEISGLVGVLFDRDAAGYWVKRERIEATPKNVRGGYYNLFMNADVQLMNDMTEKSVILLLD